MSVRKVDLKLVYDSKDITADIWKFVISFRYVDRTLPDKMDELSLTLQDVDGLWSGDWFPQSGAKFRAMILASNWFNPDDEFARDCGSFEIDDLTASGPPSIFNISALSVGITNSIRRQENTQAWETMDFEGIANEIARRNGFELKFYSSYNPIMERWEQKSESDLSFLKKICAFAGFTLKLTGEYIVIFQGEEFDSVEPEITIRREGDGVKNHSFNSNSNDIYSACEVKYYDSEKDEFFEYLYVPDGISGLRNPKTEKTAAAPKTRQVIDRDTRMVRNVEIPPPPAGDAPVEITEPTVGRVLKVNRRVSSLAEAENLAKSSLRSKNMRQMTGSLSLIGRPDLYSGMNVKVEGFGLFDTVIWNVEEVTHDYSRSGGYNSSVQLRGVLGY